MTCVETLNEERYPYSFLLLFLHILSLCAIISLILFYSGHTIWAELF